MQISEIEQSGRRAQSDRERGLHLNATQASLLGRAVKAELVKHRVMLSYTRFDFGQTKILFVVNDEPHPHKK